MTLRAYVSSGGGVRIGATFGATLEGERRGKFDPQAFELYAGTSAGALDATLTANGWTSEQKVKLFLDTDFGRFFRPLLVPYGLRKMMTPLSPISLHRLADFIDSLTKRNPFGPPIKPVRGLLVNAVRANRENKQVIFCEEKPSWLRPDDTSEVITEAFSRLGFGKVLTRSMVLPGLIADEPAWFDGGVAENPILSVIPNDAAILLIHLGYAGLIGNGDDFVPDGLLARALYCYERKSYQACEHLISHFPNLRMIRPGVYDVDSTAFNMSRTQKQTMISKAQYNTQTQWMAL